jgi:acid phosphatase
MRQTGKFGLYAGVGAALLAASFVGGYVSGKHAATPSAPSQDSPAGPPLDHEMINAVLWERTAAEYRAVTWQAYRLAKERLDRALADPSWTASPEQGRDFASLPPAIILDVDETVLDNTEYEARLIRGHREYTPASFHSWCAEKRSAAIPGAKGFLEYAAKKGVAIFYTTDRSASVREATRDNLERLGFPVGPGVENVLCHDGTTLSERRRKVVARYRVVLQLGDNVNDFVDGGHGPPEQRRALVEKYRDYWGTRWIILPNAIYGQWEAALYDFDYDLPWAEKLRRKMAALEK